jgi:GDP-D-mannose 3',5'-epimerase
MLRSGEFRQMAMAPDGVGTTGAGIGGMTPVPMGPGAGPVLVAGAGGFIGGHLVATLVAAGFTVRAVDRKPLSAWYQRHEGVDNRQGDLSKLDDCRVAAAGVAQIYNLAADMGGMGFIETHKAECMLSVLINTHLLMAAREFGVKRFFFASSACVYAAYKQTEADLVALKEADAYPAMPEDGYGWEKLFSERMCRHFTEDYGIVSRVARFHNVYGPNGTYDGGREKAPAAICRKVIQAKLAGTHKIDIWGDGHQTRSFMYIDDCTRGSKMIMDSNIDQPINLGSSEMVSINQLVDMVEDIAGVKLVRNYQLDAPKGVRGRNSDNTLIQSLLGWEPSISLRHGLEQTYRWIHDDMTNPEGSRIAEADKALHFA